MSTRKPYTLKVPRFDPFKNIYVGVDCLMKICTRSGAHVPLNYGNWCKDSQRAYGFKSQCRQSQRDYNNERKLKAHNEY